MRMRQGGKASIGWVLSNLRVRSRGLKSKALARLKTSISWVRYKVRRGKSGENRLHHLSPKCSTLHIYLINLKSEPERLARSVAEINRLGLGKPERLEAIDGWKVFPELGSEAGRRGCAESHISVLKQHLRHRPNQPALIFEDDILFVDPDFARSAIYDFLGDDSVDVLCVHGFFGRSREISTTLGISTQISSAAAYAVKPWATEPLLNEFAKSATKYDQGFRGAKYNVDIMWQPLQWRRLVFAVPNHRVAHQAEGYSQTEARSLKKR